MKEQKRPINTGIPEQGRFGLPKRPYRKKALHTDENGRAAQAVDTVVHGMKKEGEEAQATAMGAVADMDVEKKDCEGALETGQCLIGTQEPTNIKKKTNFAHQLLRTHNLKAGQEHALGTTVRMLFDDGVWYSGTVTKFDLRSKHYTVEFEDGDLQETKIPDKDVEVEQGQVHAASAGAGKAAKGERTSLSDEEGP